MMNTLLEEASFVCLDTETTGLNPLAGGRICEVALLASKGGRRTASYTTLLNPSVVISPDVTAIHGITNEMVATAPKFGDIAPKLIGLLENSVLICHNADFDTAFLANEFLLTGLQMPPVIILDTLKFARTNGNFSKNHLGVIAEELGISSQGWHRAMADTVMTEKIFYYFMYKFKRAGAKTVADLHRLQTQKI